MRHRFILLCLCVSLSSSSLGCSSASSRKSPEHQLAGGPIEIDIFSARGFLGGSDYERYFLKGDVLWRECGNVERRKREKEVQKLDGDNVLRRDPQLRIRERRVEKVKHEQQQALAIAASELFETLSQQDANSPLPAPGSVFSLSDPGLVEMAVSYGDRKERLITSVDAVADGKTKSLEKAQLLFSKLRAIGPTICNATTFFGIDRTAH